MKRDGATQSIWQENAADYQSINAWNKDDVFDVLITGGGITGLTTALLLQESGKKCILAEAVNIGFGTTGGTTGHLNTIPDSSYDRIMSNFSEKDAQSVAAGMREAIDLVEGLTIKYGIDADFRYEPSYVIAVTEEESIELEQMMKSSVMSGVVADRVSHVPAPLPFRKACRFEFQARIHPVKYLQGLARAFEENGGIILQNCTVYDVTKGDILHADTTFGAIKAKHIVYATHIPPGINLLHFRCAPYRSYLQAFTLKDDRYPGGLIYDLKKPYNYYHTQELNGKKYVIAGGHDHKTGHETNMEKIFREQEGHLRKYFNIDEVVYRWSSQFFENTDGLPYIGLLPGEDRIYTATGFSGTGLTFGSLSAKIICSLITTENNKYAELFSPSRIKPVAGFQHFIKENADAAMQFFKLRMSYEKIEELAQLATGEAILAHWENNKVALYKDETGKIHALDPVCPHAKCIVAWNNSEKSWDCPCHGSRFACNGALLTGPATTGLKQIKWEDIEGD